jgi:hypothetical protein
MFYETHFLPSVLTNSSCSTPMSAGSRRQLRGTVAVHELVAAIQVRASYKPSDFRETSHLYAIPSSVDEPINAEAQRMRKACLCNFSAIMVSPPAIMTTVAK